MEIVSNKSSIVAGSGNTMRKMIATTKITTPKSLDFPTSFKKGKAFCIMLVFCSFVAICNIWSLSKYDKYKQI